MGLGNGCGGFGWRKGRDEEMVEVVEVVGFGGVNGKVVIGGL